MSTVQKDSPTEAPLQLGRRLRYRRLAEGLTLKELAFKADCSESMLSKIENDKASPSLATLHRIASALNTNVSEMLGPTDDDLDKLVLRSGFRPLIRAGRRADGSDGVNLERLTPPGDNRLLQADIYIIQPGCGSEGLVHHEGEELGYVLEGTLELVMDDETHILEAGDSFVFRSELFHGFANVGDTVARVIWVNTPPTF